MFQLPVNTLCYGAAFVSFLWLESFGIGMEYICASSRERQPSQPCQSKYLLHVPIYPE
jgi:hypothetical protein